MTMTEERDLMPQEETAGNSAASRPRCQIEKTVLDQECERLGEIRYGGTLLCEPHAALLGLETRAEALLGTVFQMDGWMKENGSSSADEEFLGRVRHERDRVVAALRLTRAQLRSARKALEEEGVAADPYPEASSENTSTRQLGE